MNFAERFADGRVLEHPECKGVLQTVHVERPIRVSGSVEIADLYEVHDSALPVGNLAPGDHPLDIRVLNTADGIRTAALILGDQARAVHWKIHDLEEDDLWSTFALYSGECRDDLDNLADQLVGDPPIIPDPIHRALLGDRAVLFWLEEEASVMGVHHGFDSEGRLVCIGIDLGVLWETRAEAGRIPVDPFDQGPVTDPWLHDLGVEVRTLATPFPGHILAVEVDDPGAVTLRFVDSAGRPLPGNLETYETVQGWEVRLQTPVLQTGPVNLQLELAPTSHPL